LICLLLLLSILDQVAALVERATALSAHGEARLACHLIDAAYYAAGPNNASGNDSLLLSSSSSSSAAVFMAMAHSQRSACGRVQAASGE
jgi:hypothetical protein